MSEIVLIHKELGSLEAIAGHLFKEMKEEIKRNGHSDLTLSLEGSCYGILEILNLNNVVEKQA